MLQGKAQEEVPEAIAGDIIAIAKFDDLHVSDTVSNVGGNTAVSSLKVRPISFPTPMVPRAVVPKAREDEAKISAGLAKIADEDPTFSIRRDTQTHELVISGMSDLHLDVIQQRLKNRYKLEMTTHIPHVPYLETISSTAEADHRHKKQSGGRGQFGEVHLRVRPVERGKGFNFVDAVKGGTIPNQYIPAVEKGVREQMDKGVISGNQVVDIEVEVYFGKDHPVDSSEQAFKTAAADGLPQGVREGLSRAPRAHRIGRGDRPRRQVRRHLGRHVHSPRTYHGHGFLARRSPGNPGDRAPGRDALVCDKPQEHDRGPGIIHHGAARVRARPAQRPAANRREIPEVARGDRGRVNNCFVLGVLCEPLRYPISSWKYPTRAGFSPNACIACGGP